MADKKENKRFLHNLFHDRKRLSCSLFIIVFICFLIAILNFTTVYLHCLRDMRTEDSRPMAVKCGSAMPDTVNIIVVPDTMITKIVVLDTLKNGCCHCTQSQDSKRDLETLEDIHKIFDDNLLTFLISFALIAVLTMLLNDRTEYSNRISEMEDSVYDKLRSIENNSQTFQNNIQKELKHIAENNENSLQEKLKQIEDSIPKIVYDARINNLRTWIFVCEMHLIYHESKHIVFEIETLKYSINELLYAAIESLRIKIDDSNREIPPYSDKLKDDAVFSSDDINNIIAPLLNANNSFEDLYRSARRYESKLKTRKPNLMLDLQRQTAPLSNSINSLIEKIEGYRAAPKNQQLS